MATGQGNTPRPFLGQEDRPNVYTLLDKPIRELTPRQLAEVFAALGMASGPVSKTMNDAELGEVLNQNGEFTELEDSQFDAEYEFEKLLADLAAEGVPVEGLRDLDPEAFLAQLETYTVSAALMQRARGIKAIIDKVRRDKPRVDKAIKDGKQAADKFISDGKSRVDKVLGDGKTWVDKQLQDKGRVKDALDAKEIKDLFEGAVVTPGVSETNAAELADRVDAMRAEFEAIAKQLRG